eukprot:7231048-Alexandrium_andersonii.AAC.1
MGSALPHVLSPSCGPPECVRNQYGILLVLLWARWELNKGSINVQSKPNADATEAQFGIKKWHEGH